MEQKFQTASDLALSAPLNTTRKLYSTRSNACWRVNLTRSSVAGTSVARPATWTLQAPEIANLLETRQKAEGPTKKAWPERVSRSTPSYFRM
jgi:hypothetical protein